MNTNRLRLILASASPRRRELLSAEGYDFEVVSPEIDETPWPNEPPDSYVLRMAHEKACAIAAALKPGGEPARILAADTTVVLDREILGKPAHERDAARMLRALSGQTHHVITGVCLLILREQRETVRGEAVRTRVIFREVGEEDIARYVATGEPMDKAGAYAIQGGAAGMVERIEGSYSNVVGLPMEAVARLLAHAGG